MEWSVICTWGRKEINSVNWSCLKCDSDTTMLTTNSREICSVKLSMQKRQCTKESDWHFWILFSLSIKYPVPRSQAIWVITVSSWLSAWTQLVFSIWTQSSTDFVHGGKTLKWKWAVEVESTIFPWPCRGVRELQIDKLLLQPVQEEHWFPVTWGQMLTVAYQSSVTVLKCVASQHRIGSSSQPGMCGVWEEMHCLPCRLVYIFQAD